MYNDKVKQQLNIQNPVTKIKNVYFRSSVPNYIPQLFLLITALHALAPSTCNNDFWEAQHNSLENTRNSFH